MGAKVSALVVAPKNGVLAQVGLYFSGFATNQALLGVGVSRVVSGTPD